MSEFGIVLPLKAEVVRCEARNHLEDLPGYANTVVGDLLSEVAHLDECIKQYDAHIRSMARDCTLAQRLMQLMGVGETTSTALVAMIGNASEFDNGRQLAAWLGLVPGQYSSGGKTRLGRITKAGDAYVLACWCSVQEPFSMPQPTRPIRSAAGPARTAAVARMRVSLT
jgi:transposase